MDPGQRLSIDVIAANGKPIEPKEHAIKFVNQCGVVARDNVPITVQEWNQPKNRPGVIFLSDRAKDDLWTKLMTNFNLPPDCNLENEDGTPNPEGERRTKKVREFALGKMAEAFRNWKKNLWADYVKKEKKAPPVFKGTLEKWQPLWPEFVAYKESSVAKERSEKNKKNAQKKKYHHKLGTGGYKSAVPKWEAMEAEMRGRGITPGTDG